MPQSLGLPALYPAIDICEFCHEPLCPYVPDTGSSSDPGTSAYPTNVYEIYAPSNFAVVRANDMEPISTRLQAVYPTIEMCALLLLHESRW